MYGPTAINVFQLMETLRQGGELFTIGAETALLEARDKRRAERGVFGGGLSRAAKRAGGLHRLHCGMRLPPHSAAEGQCVSGPVCRALASQRGAAAAVYAKLPAPAGEIHLQVSTLRESSADYRKFYIHTGTATISLRAESKCACLAGGAAALQGWLSRHGSRGAIVTWWPAVRLCRCYGCVEMLLGGGHALAGRTAGCGLRRSRSPRCAQS